MQKAFEEPSFRARQVWTSDAGNGPQSADLGAHLYRKICKLYKNKIIAGVYSVKDKFLDCKIEKKNQINLY